MRQKHFFVYIMGSLSGTLYTGMTNNLHKRVWQHREHEFEGFTEQYEVDRLLYGSRSAMFVLRSIARMRLSSISYSVAVYVE